jgi:hypothetical protein
MKNVTIAIVTILFLTVMPAHGAKVKMPPAPAIDMGSVTPLPLTACLDLGEDFRTRIEVVKTSPFDKLKFPVGQFTTELLEKNLPAIFADLRLDPAKAEDLDVRVSAQLLRFEVTIPHPAYNPYHAAVVLKVIVSDPDGEVIFTQTAAGEGQTSKGMMSGFKAKAIAAESVKLAVVDAATQVFEGLLEAEDFREVGHEAPGQ